MNFEKRMPRFEKVPLLKYPDNMKKWLETRQFAENELTVYRLRDVWLRNPDLENLAIEQMFTAIEEKKRQRKYEENNKIILKEEKVATLLEYLSNNDFFDSRIEIIDRIMSLDGDIYRDFLARLNEKYSDVFFDNVTRVLARKIKEKDLFEELFSLLKNNIVRDPSDFSSILQIMGLSKNKLVPSILFSFYTFFQDNFPDKPYFEGPLLGMLYYFEEKDA